MLAQSPTFGDPRLPARFWRKVRIGSVPSHRPELGPCWEWVGGRWKGYGRLKVGSRADDSRRTVSTHRLVYEVLTGPIPNDMTIDHLCRNRACVRLGHFEVVDNQTNILRGNGWSGLNARKTHCPQGHAYSGANLRIRRSGRRACRECGRSRARAKLNALYWREYRRTRREAGRPVGTQSPVAGLRTVTTEEATSCRVLLASPNTIERNAVEVLP